jgi:hypothetical protein
VIHLGDIKPGTDTSPSVGAYLAAADMFLQSPVPVFVLVGDNDYYGTSNDELALSNWRSVFLGFDNNWDHGIQVNWQGGSNENFSFVFKDTLFVSFNYYDDNAAWFQENFDLYGDDVSSAVVVSHAIATDGHYEAFASTFIQVAEEFGKPMVHLHGHKHTWGVSHPYSAANVTELIVTQTALKAGDYGPLLVTVSDENPDIFTWEHDL